MKKITRRNYLSHNLTFGQRAADKLTSFCGSWHFIISLFIFMFLWIIFNVVVIVEGWDPYPFILLNFVLSCLAAIQAPIILMSQKREEQRERLKAERDYMVNRKAEREIEHIQKELDTIRNMLYEIKKNKKA
ncbi:MAG: DUF1003 domain-containing protein [Candidatus Nanoarchaeia archaeon]